MVRSQGKYEVNCLSAVAKDLIASVLYYRADSLIVSCMVNHKCFVQLLQTTFSFDFSTHHDTNIVYV